MIRMFLLVFLSVIGLQGGMIAQAGTLQAEKYVSVRVSADKTDVKPGDILTVGLEQNIAPGWHVYWVNPGDSGIATTVDWTSPKGLKADPILWPTPHKLPYGPLTNYGYEGKATLIQRITLPDRLPEGAFDLSADIDLLVCQEICLPESHTVSLILNGATPGSAVDIERARTHLPVDTGWEANMREEGENIIVDLRTTQTDLFVKPETIEFFPEEWGIIHNSAPGVATLNDTGLTFIQKRGERSLNEVPVSKALLAYEDAQGTRKAVRVSILSEGAGHAAVDTPATPDLALWQAALLALLGGLILNLMPCVFPVLSIKALSLAKLGDKERAHARGYGLAYTLGILMSFAVIAGGLMALQAAGSEIGWGFQLQNPAVILGLTYLLFLMGLNLSGYFEFSGGWTNIGGSLVQKQGYAGSFFTGVLATLVATPCTAPFMGVAMGFALTQPPLEAMTVFMAMGLGLALPYLLLCFIPWLRKCLPRPGAWMDIFKQFLAFPMFLSAAWLVWVLAQQTDAITVFYALIGMVGIALIIWLVRHWPARAGVKIISSALILASGLFILMTLIMPHPEKAEGALAVTHGDQNWESFTQSRLDQLLAQGDPVFVNMTAAWCITCKVNDNVAINVESTRAFFAEKGIRYLKGDWTNQNPEITKYLSAYGRSGVPIYVFYPARDENTGERPKEIILPQILTPAIVTNSLSGENVSE